MQSDRIQLHDPSMANGDHDIYLPEIEYQSSLIQAHCASRRLKRIDLN